MFKLPVQNHGAIRRHVVWQSARSKGLKPHLLSIGAMILLDRDVKEREQPFDFKRLVGIG